MRHIVRLGLRVFAICVFGLSTAHSANQQLSPQDIVIRGHFAEAKIPFTVPANASNQAVEFSLTLSISGLVDFDDSAITAVVDGLPIATRQLSKLEADGTVLRWRFQAELQNPGQHLLTIRANLNSSDQQCARRWLKETWLRIHQSSQLALSLIHI